MFIHAAEKVQLVGDKEQIRADVTEGRKTNVWGNLMHEVYPCAGQKVLDNKYQSRGKEQWSCRDYSLQNGPESIYPAIALCKLKRILKITVVFFLSDFSAPYLPIFPSNAYYPCSRYYFLFTPSTIPG